MNDSTEKRRSFRIIEPALVQYQVIDDEQFAKGIARWRIRQGEPASIRSKVMDIDARLDELLYRVNNDSQPTCDALKLLNEKIDVVAQALPEFTSLKEDLASQPSQTCELSAEGMAFGANEPLSPGTKLVLRFFLISDNRFFETFCHVVRLSEGDAAASAPYKYRVAVEFDGMDSAEREVLFQHLFSKQSETLRMRRIQSESG